MTFGRAAAYAVNTAAEGQSTDGTACTFSQLYPCNAERLAGKQLVPLNRKWLSRPETEPQASGGVAYSCTTANEKRPIFLVRYR